MGRKKGSKNKVKKEEKVTTVKTSKKRRKYLTKAIKDEQALLKKMNELSTPIKKNNNNTNSNRKNQQAIYVSNEHLLDINLSCEYLEEVEGGNLFICNNPDAVKYYRKKLNIKNFADFLLWKDVKKCKFKKIT